MAELNKTLSQLALSVGPVHGTVLLRIDFERLLVGGDSVFEIAGAIVPERHNSQLVGELDLSLSPLIRKFFRIDSFQSFSQVLDRLPCVVAAGFVAPDSLVNATD